MTLQVKIDTTENKHWFGIYAVVNQVTLHPKQIIHIFVSLSDFASSFLWVWVNQTLQICSSGFNKLKIENEKNKTKNFIGTQFLKGNISGTAGKNLSMKFLDFYIYGQTTRHSKI